MESSGGGGRQVSMMMTASNEDEYSLPLDADMDDFEKQTEEDLKLRMTPLPIKQGMHIQICLYRDVFGDTKG